MSADTLTVGELVDELRRLHVHNNDFTSVVAIELRPQFQRVMVRTETDIGEQTEQQKNLIAANAQLRAEHEKLKCQSDKLRRGLRAIRRQIRTRKPKLP